eukprot:ANDGO_07316.mRNA.1 ABC transporter G family member 16
MHKRGVYFLSSLFYVLLLLLSSYGAMEEEVVGWTTCTVGEGTGRSGGGGGDPVVSARQVDSVVIHVPGVPPTHETPQGEAQHVWKPSVLTATPKEELTIHWHNVSFCVHTKSTGASGPPLPWKLATAVRDRVRHSLSSRKANRDRSSENVKCILKNVSGYAKPGRCLAIMGPSGSGKTTLLNVIAGRARAGLLAGNIHINDYPNTKTPSILRSRGAYVLQADLMMENLTCRELLSYSARLRNIEDACSKDRTQQRVDRVLRELGLLQSQRTLISQISGGQKKRVAISEALLDDSVSIVMLDEPTSGLDSYTAIQLVALMKSIAIRDRVTVIMTIHQPAWELLELFDDLCILAEGRTMYFGPVSESPAYFDSVGLPVPRFANPADHFLRAVVDTPIRKNGHPTRENSGPVGASRSDARRPSFTGADLADLADRTDQTFQSSSERAAEEISVQAQSSHERAALDALAQDLASRFRRSPYGIELEKELSKCDRIVHGAAGMGSAVDALGHPVESQINLTKLSSLVNNPLNVWKQTVVLTSRAWVSNSREPVVLRARFVQVLFIALLVGILFWKLGDNQQSVQNRSGAIAFLVINSSFSALAAIIFVFPREKPIYQREFAAGMYNSFSYFISRSLAEFPLMLFFPLLLNVVVYWMVGFQDTAWSFFRFLFILELVSNAGASLAYVISAAAPNGDVAQALMPLILIPMMLFGGFFVNTDTVPAWIAWLKYVSLIFYGFQALIQVEYSGLTLHCDNSELVQSGSQSICPITSGQQAIDALDIQFTYWECFFILLGLFIGFRVLAYLILWAKSRKLSGSYGAKTGLEVISVEEMDRSISKGNTHKAPAVFSAAATAGY